MPPDRLADKQTKDEPRDEQVTLTTSSARHGKLVACAADTLYL